MTSSFSAGFFDLLSLNTAPAASKNPAWFKSVLNRPKNNHLNLLIEIRDTLCTKCVTDLDKKSKMILFQSILTTFEASVLFLRHLGSGKNWLKPKNQTTNTKFNLSKSLKRSLPHILRWTFDLKFWHWERMVSSCF